MKKLISIAASLRMVFTLIQARATTIGRNLGESPSGFYNTVNMCIKTNYA